MAWEEFENTNLDDPIRVEIGTKDNRVVKGLLVGDPRGSYIVDADGGERVWVRREDVSDYAQWPARLGTGYLGEPRHGYTT